jgi:DNA-damage-inducible protein J
MATTNVSVRLDEQLKRDAEELFDDLGMNMTTAMTMFLKQAIRYQGLPFDVKRDVPNSDTLAAIDDVNNNRNMSRTFSSVAEMMEDLRA